MNRQVNRGTRGVGLCYEKTEEEAWSGSFMAALMVLSTQQQYNEEGRGWWGGGQALSWGCQLHNADIFSVKGRGEDRGWVRGAAGQDGTGRGGENLHRCQSQTQARSWKSIH